MSALVSSALMVAPLRGLKVRVMVP